MARILLFRVVVVLVLTGLRIADTTMTGNNTLPEMPLSFFRNEGFFDAVVAGSKNFTKFMTDRFFQKPVALPSTEKGVKGDKGYSRSDSEATINSEYAGCEVYEQAVPIPNDRTNIVLHPSCVKLKRCGGCCVHSQLTCKPKEIQKRKIKVDRYEYKGTMLTPSGVIHVEVEDHTKCECECKVTEEDCNNEIHVYDNFNCACKCKEKARACPSHMRWNENICQCQCIDVLFNCGAYAKFDPTTCSCENPYARAGGMLQAIALTPKGTEITTTPVPTTKAPCTHLKCPCFYKAVMKNGICKCVFSRSSGKKCKKNN